MQRHQSKVCYAWMQSGYCSRGADCRFLHSQQPQQQQHDYGPSVQQLPQHGVQHDYSSSEYVQQDYQGPRQWQSAVPAWGGLQEQQYQHQQGTMRGLHPPGPQHMPLQDQYYDTAVQQPMQDPYQQQYDPAMQQPMQQPHMPAQQQPMMYPGQMQQPMQPPMRPQNHSEGPTYKDGPPAQDGAPYWGPPGPRNGPPAPRNGPAGFRDGPTGPRGLQGFRARSEPRQELPPEPTEPAYKTRTWHKPVEDEALAKGLKVRVMSYNLLADELAHTHRGELYYHTAMDHLLWPRRWGLIKEEIEHYKPDVLCLQEVDHWRQVKDELQELGYEGQYLQRSGGRPDGCATLWRSSRFELVAVTRLNFSEFDLRDNVGLMAVLKNRAAAAGAGHRQAPSSRSRRPPRRSRSGRRVGSSSESTSSSESESQSSDEDRTVPVPRVDLRAAEEAAAARNRGRVYRRAGSRGRGIRSSPTRRGRDESPDARKPRGRKAVAAAVAAAAADSPSKYGQFLAVANTHVLFNPKRGDIKLAQLRLLLHHLQVLIAAAVPEDQAGHVAAMIMGDFNSKPDTPLYQFMRQGWIDCLQHHRKDMAGNISTAPSPYQRQSFNRQSRMLPQHQQAQMLQYGMQGQQQQYQQHGMQWPVQGAAANVQLQVQLQQNPALGMQQQRQGQARQYALQHQQSQPNLQGQQQQQGQAGMRRSASAPALTLRRLKQAGWTAEELITATGGAYNTHLRHFLQQHREQQQAELTRQRQQQQGQDPDGADSGEEMDLTPDDAVRGAAGTAPAWGQQRQQQQQQVQGQQQWQQMAAGGAQGVGGDSGDEMDLSDDEGRRSKAARVAGAVPTGDAGYQMGLMPMQQQLSAPAPPPAAAAAMQAGTYGTQAGSFGPPPPLATAARAGTQGPASQDMQLGQQQHGHQRQQQQQQQQQQRQQGGRQGGGGRGGRGSHGRGGQQSLSSGDEFEIEEVPFFLKRAPAHRMDEPLPASVGDGIARHELTLRSCYAEVLGSEPEYTSCHDAFWGTVDFIFYTPQEGRAVLQPVSVLLPPEPLTHLSRRRCMPNATIPSDHISLVADFMLSVASRSRCKVQ